MLLFRVPTDKPSTYVFWKGLKRERDLLNWANPNIRMAYNKRAMVTIFLWPKVWISNLENMVIGNPAKVPTARDIPMRNLVAPKSSKCQKRKFSRYPQRMPATKKADKKAKISILHMAWLKLARTLAPRGWKRSHFCHQDEIAYVCKVQFYIITLLPRLLHIQQYSLQWRKTKGRIKYKSIVTKNKVWTKSEFK